jgi:Ca2+-binding RTX toxin-like protein
MATIHGNGFGNTLDERDGVTEGDDTIHGHGGSDTILGWDGNDSIRGGNGRDYLDGGNGIDTAVYDDSDVGVVVNLEFGAFFQEQRGGTAEGDRLFNIENLIGSSHDDALTGDAHSNVLDGGDGDDYLDGGNGINTLIGGAGADELIGGPPGDRGGLDTASYVTAPSRVVASLASGGTVGDAAGDTFSYIDNLTGSSFDDALTGNGGDNTLDGGDGDDKLQGGAGADTLIGGRGTDTATYTNSDSGVTVHLAAGHGSGGTAEADTLSEIENITGSIYADVLTGDIYANHLRGMAGGDTLTSGGGGDILDGGSGIDTVRYGDSSSGVTVNLLVGTASGGTAEGDTLIDIENLSGSWLADALTGDDGSNRLAGDDGDDWLKGGGGADTLDGGDGNDTATYLDYGSGVTVNLGSGTGSGGAAEGDTLIDIENLYGTAYADTLTGDAGGNILHGDDGDDTLRGAGGKDTLKGGNGADELSGGSSSDTAIYTGSTAGVVVNLTTGTGSGGAAEGDTLTSIENLVGSAYADALTGDGYANWLYGEDGHDVLWGGGGADTLYGGDGVDTAIYLDSTAGVSMDLLNGTGSGGTAEGDTLTSIESLLGSVFDDELTGDNNDNLLQGSLGGDELEGNGGADILVGGKGTDALSGGSGGDAFVWATIDDTGTTVDTADAVSDFDFAEGDRINLAGIDANVYIGGNQSFTFIGAADFTLDATTADPDDVTPGEIRYYHADGDTFIELQTGTSPDIEGLIRIAGIVTPDASWFVL